MPRLFQLAVAASVGFWINEGLHHIYNHTLHAPARATTHRRSSHA